jgi:hypothetical protein
MKLTCSLFFTSVFTWNRGYFCFVPKVNDKKVDTPKFQLAYYASITQHTFTFMCLSFQQWQALVSPIALMKNAMQWVQLILWLSVGTPTPCPVAVLENPFCTASTGVKVILNVSMLCVRCVGDVDMMCGELDRKCHNSRTRRKYKELYIWVCWRWWGLYIPNAFKLKNMCWAWKWWIWCQLDRVVLLMW